MSKQAKTSDTNTYTTTMHTFRALEHVARDWQTTKRAALNFARTHAVRERKCYGRIHLSASDIAIYIVRPLTCGMRKDCGAPVTMLDEKGFAYCTEHGVERRSHGPRCRRLTTAELLQLRLSIPLAGYSKADRERSKRNGCSCDRCNALPKEAPICICWEMGATGDGQFHAMCPRHAGAQQ